MDKIFQAYDIDIRAKPFIKCFGSRDDWKKKNLLIDGKDKHKKGNIQPIHLHIQQAVFYVSVINLKIKGLLIFTWFPPANLAFVKFLKGGNGHTMVIWEQHRKRGGGQEVPVLPLAFKL